MREFIDLRSSLASRVPAPGASSAMIDKRLGHVWLRTTARSAPLARDLTQTAPSRVTEGIGGLLKRVGGKLSAPSRREVGHPYGS